MNRISTFQKVTQQVSSLVVFTGLIPAVMATMSLMASLEAKAAAAPMAPACCNSPAACAAMAQSLVQTCTTTPSLHNSCNALHNITTERWFLLTEDAQTLPRDKKDMAGNYQLDLNTLKLMSDWRAGDAPGITRDGRGEISVKKVCIAEQSLLIAGRVNMFVSFEMEILSAPEVRVRNSQQVSGYLVQSGGERFFFTRP
jgi:hypothetical protein